MDLQTCYGIKIDPDHKPVRAIQIDLTGDGGQRLVIKAAKRVVSRRSTVHRVKPLPPRQRRPVVHNSIIIH